jgi:hypothetical protein
MGKGREYEDGKRRLYCNYREIKNGRYGEK